MISGEKNLYCIVHREKIGIKWDTLLCHISLLHSFRVYSRYERTFSG